MGEALGGLGPREEGWATWGVSATSIAARSAGAQVLGEWASDGGEALVAGDAPLPIPQNMHRYSVRAFDGPVHYHQYNRLAPGIVLHSFGSVLSVGNAECIRSQGIELISRLPWRQWPEETAMLAFAMARLSRDYPGTICAIYRPAGDGRYRPFAYSRDGRPYRVANEQIRTLILTPRDDAAARLFSQTATAPPAGD